MKRGGEERGCVDHLGKQGKHSSAIFINARRNNGSTEEGGAGFSQHRRTDWEIVKHCTGHHEACGETRWLPGMSCAQASGKTGAAKPGVPWQGRTVAGKWQCSGICGKKGARKQHNNKRGSGSVQPSE